MLNSEAFRTQMAIRSSVLSRELIDKLSDMHSRNEKTEIKKIQIWRNHNFESIARTIDLLIRDLGFSIEWNYSEYDDSLQFDLKSPSDFDLEIVWFDVTRFEFSEADLKEWLVDQIKNRMLKTTTPFFLLVTLGLPSSIDSCMHFRLEEILPKKELEDSRMYNLFGTSISDFGQKSIAKWLSYKILPSHFGSFKKIIAVDMDDTLHLGLLGEDGIKNVLVSAAHRKFQEYLIHLKSEGFLLVLVTKNHLEDVLKLLDSEAYHIKSGDFIRIYSGWEPKAHYIGLALDELNLHESSLIFIDDNQGELANFSLIFPSADLIQAEPDANITTMRLEFTPGILRLVEDSEGKKREEDLTANVSRKTLSNIIEKKAEYLVALKPRVEFLRGEHLDLERFASQSLRTNQFNVNLAKFSVQKLEQVLETMEFDLVQIKYSDTFGDSGIIGSIAFKFEKNILTIEQVYISCRTLGRGIEFEILEELMFFIHQIHPSATRLRIFWRKSSRNEPALRWLEAFASKDLIGDFGMIEIECSKLSRADLFEVIYH